MYIIKLLQGWRRKRGPKPRDVAVCPEGQQTILQAGATTSAEQRSGGRPSFTSGTGYDARGRLSSATLGAADEPPLAKGKGEKGEAYHAQQRLSGQRL